MAKKEAVAFGGEMKNGGKIIQMGQSIRHEKERVKVEKFSRQGTE